MWIRSEQDKTQPRPANTTNNDQADAGNDKADGISSAAGPFQPQSGWQGSALILDADHRQRSLHESLACFRMLAEVMGLPFRRDALEKTIRDALRRGKQPNLPMLGQLVAGMGLGASRRQGDIQACARA